MSGMQDASYDIRMLGMSGMMIGNEGYAVLLYLSALAA